jgi:hypothetical protein
MPDEKGMQFLKTHLTIEGQSKKGQKARHLTLSIGLLSY